MWDLSSLTEKDDDQKAAERYEQGSRARMAMYMDDLNFEKNSKKGDRDIRDHLSDTTLNIGTGSWAVDTGVSISPQQSALLAGAGDQVGDVWRGIAQIMKEAGVADLIDIEAQDQNEDIMRQLYGDEALGNPAKVGAVVGAVAEPAGLLMPWMKAKKMSTAVLGSAALGATYGASLYVDHDESRMTNAAISASLMGVLGAGFHKYFAHAVGDDVAKILDDVLEEEAEVVSRAIPGTDEAGGKPYSRKDYEDSTGKRRSRKGSRLNKETAKKTKKRKPRRQTKAEIKSDTVEKLEVKASFEGRRQGFLSKLWGTVKGEGEEGGTIFNRAMQPIYDNIKKTNGHIAAQLRVTDGLHHILKKKWEDRAIGWMKWHDKLDKASKTRLKKLINNGGYNKATMQAVRELGGPEAVRHAKLVQQVMKEIHGELKSVGYKIGDIPNYHPNSVQDLAGLVKKRQGQVDKAIAKAVAAKGGKALTQNEKAHIAQHMFEFDVRYSNTAGSLKSRKKFEISDDELDFYHDPVSALANYIGSMAEDVAKRRFFKGFGYRPDGRKGLNASGADLDDSITALIDRIQKDVPDIAKQNELVNNLRARFGSDVHKTHRFIQGMKNLSYAGTLGNFWSAMTQVGDLVFAFHKYGIRNAVASVLGAKVTSKEALGIEKAMQELASSRGFTNKIADWAFDWSGFSRIDAFGKNVNLNASLRLNKKLATNDMDKFVRKYKDWFGNETEALGIELRNLELKKGAAMSDNMKLMLWNDLAETQPIGLSEMPQYYLKNPNGRIIYAYKTFALKQFNYMRNTILADGNPVRRATNLTYFASMFVAANTGIDMFKDFMKGGDLTMEDAALDNLYTLALTSKYGVEKSKGLGSLVLEAMLPVPVTQLQRSVDAVGRDGVGVAGEAVQHIPVAGRPLRYWGGVE